MCRPQTGQAWRRPTCTHLPPGGPRLNEPGLFSDEHTWAKVLSQSAGLSQNKVEDKCSESSAKFFVTRLYPLFYGTAIYVGAQLE